MWSRCWWATWVSGFFGIAGVLHIARYFTGMPLRVGAYDVPLMVSLAGGIVFVIVSAGFLWIEVQRERAKRCAAEKNGA